MSLLSPSANSSITETKRFFLTTILTAIFTALYLTGIILAVRNSLWLEIFISLGFPLFMLLTKRARHFFRKPVHMVMKRVFQLVIFESFYNVIVIASLISIYIGNTWGNTIASWGFVLFFIIQAGGFFVAQIQRKKPHGVFQSAVLVSCILIWWYGTEDASGIVDGQGRFLMWGEDAPLAVKLIYTIWAINGLLYDTTALPRLTQAIVHLVSIALCWWAAEFFHVRLLTACHLFLLDGIFAYSISDPLGVRICVMPEAYFERFRKHIQPWISIACSFFIFMVAIVSMLSGGLEMNF